MKRTHLWPLLLLLVCCASCEGQNKPGPTTNNLATSPGTNQNYVHTQYEYTDSFGKSLIIQNSLPRGGIKYIDANGEAYVYAVFWTRIINETDNTLELKLDIPVNSYELTNLPGKYFKVLLPPDTFTLGKENLFNHGLTDIESFLGKNLHKSSSLKRSVRPKESSGFYVLIACLIEGARGAMRTGLSLKGDTLFYKISRINGAPALSSIDEKEIPCGSINFKGLMLRK